MRAVNLENISLLQLKLFVTAGKELNFTKTAKICNVTQPTVSRQLDALSNTMGVLLFIKKGNKIQLTPAGWYFHKCAEDMLFSLTNCIQQTYEIQKGYDCTLHLSIYSADPRKFLLPLIHSFKGEKDFQQVKLFTHLDEEEEAIRQLLGNKRDVIFLPLLYTDTVAKNSLLCFRTLLNIPLCANVLRQLFQGANIAPRISRYSSGALESLMNIGDDDEISISDRLSLRYGPSELVQRDIEGTHSGVIMVWLRDTPEDTALQKFIDYAIGFFRKKQEHILYNLDHSC